MLHSEQGAGDAAEAAETREEEVVLRGAVAHSIGEDTNHLPNVILSEEAFAAVDEGAEALGAGVVMPASVEDEDANGHGSTPSRGGSCCP